MTFRRIDEDTICCIITHEDLMEHGIEIEDLFQKKKEALEYIRSVVRYAAEQSGFDLEGEFTTMRLALMSDRSLNLTVTHSRSASEAMQKIRQEIQEAREAQSEQQEQEAVFADEYAFHFEQMREVLHCAKALSGRGEVSSSLYRCAREDDGYDLVIMRTQKAQSEDDYSFERLILAVNEFGTMISAGSQAAIVREHGTCILAGNALEELAKV